MLSAYFLFYYINYNQAREYLKAAILCTLLRTTQKSYSWRITAVIRLGWIRSVYKNTWTLYCCTKQSFNQNSSTSIPYSIYAEMETMWAARNYSSKCRKEIEISLIIYRIHCWRLSMYYLVRWMLSRAWCRNSMNLHLLITKTTDYWAWYSYYILWKGC